MKCPCGIYRGLQLCNNHRDYAGARKELAYPILGWQLYFQSCNITANMHSLYINVE